MLFHSSWRKRKCHRVVNSQKQKTLRNNLVWQVKCLSTEPRTSESFDQQAPVCESRAPRYTEDVMKGFQLLRLLSLLLLLSACAYAVEVTARQGYGDRSYGRGLAQHHDYGNQSRYRCEDHYDHAG